MEWGMGGWRQDKISRRPHARSPAVNRSGDNDGKGYLFAADCQFERSTAFGTRRDLEETLSSLQLFPNNAAIKLLPDACAIATDR